MPYNIQLPNGTLLRDIPDDVSRETINKQILQLPNTKVLTFDKDIYCNAETQKHEDTQHELNSKFIQYIRE